MFNLIQRRVSENAHSYQEETSQRIAWGHWFALFNIVLALLIASRYAFNADWPNTLFGKLYFFISLFGHFSFVIFAFYLLLIFPISFVIKNNRTFRGVSVIIATIGMTVLLVDTEVFKHFYLHLSPLVWDLLVNPDEAELSRQWQLLFVPMPIILLIEMLYSRWCWNKLRSFNRQKWDRFVALFFLLCFMATHLFYVWADISRYRPITAQKANYPLSYPMTARSLLEKHDLIDKMHPEFAEIEGRLDSFYLDYPKQQLIFNEPQNKINFLFINLSKLAHDDLHPEKMPMLTEVSQRSRNFTQHYTGGDSVSGGIVSLFYGLSGRYVDSILNEQKQSVFISRLQTLDYQFGLFSHNGFADPVYHRALFAHFKLPMSNSNQQAIVQWQKWMLNRQSKPFFSYLDLTMTKDPHEVDRQFAQIWDILQKQTVAKNTLLVITADIGKASQSENAFAMEKIKVPMLLYWQNGRGHYTNFSSHLDIVPTLMAQFLGSSSAVADYAQGVDLTKESYRRWILSSSYRWNVAIMPNGEQYHVDLKGDFSYYNSHGFREKQNRPPLALFLQLIQKSNEFIEN